MTSRAGDPGQWFEAQPLWFKTAVFYEIHIRGFFDGNDDGAGDFRAVSYTHLTLPTTERV